MPRFIGLTTQTGVDTTTSTAIDTGVTVDSRSGIEITAMEVVIPGLTAAPAADYRVDFILATTTGQVLFNSADNIEQISWGVQNTAGVAVAFDFEPKKLLIFPESRLTVQPLLYATLFSTGTTLTNIAYWRIFYDTVKLTDVELLRLLVGGA
jgi:hypothetical protein